MSMCDEGLGFGVDFQGGSMECSGLILLIQNQGGVCGIYGE
jgi:hypothetical protein